MDIQLVSIYTGGILSLLMVIFHVQFPTIFKWKIDFRHASAANKKILYTMHAALFLLFSGYAFVSLVYTRELAASNGLALGINLSYALFWLWRTIWQIAYFKPEKKGRFRTMHAILIIIFFILFISYSLPIFFRFL